MAQQAIWPGSGSFSSGSNCTPFALYDADASFASASVKTADWCAKRLGYPLVDIELQDVNFYACFEEATTEYGAQVYQFQIINNLWRIKGYSTASDNPNGLNPSPMIILLVNETVSLYSTTSSVLEL